MSVAFGGRRYNFDWRGFITPGVKLIVLICTGVFVTQTFVLLIGGEHAYSWILRWFALIPGAITHLLPPRIWQVFSYIFLHDPRSLWHILINMLMLWMFGRDLEAIWGKRRFLNFFVLCGVGAGVIEVIVKTIPV